MYILIMGCYYALYYTYLYKYLNGQIVAFILITVSLLLIKRI